VAGGTLPAGLWLNPQTGVLSGIPLQQDSRTVRIEVSDRSGTTAVQEITISVGPADPLVVRTQSLPTGYVGTSYHALLEAQGGVPVYSWRLTQGGLPSELFLAGSSISGEPKQAGATELTVEVEDAVGTRASGRMQLTIEPPRPAAPTQLRLQYRVSIPSAITNTVGAQLKIQNDGVEHVPLSQLAIRYYFTLENPDSLNYFCDWAAMDCKNVRHQFILISGGNACLELTFAAEAGAILPGGSSGEVQSRFAKSNWSDLVQSGDFSFDPNKGVYADWDRITVWRNGVLVWGVEP
jgi:hypothetical protein